ncbi:MAG: DUF4214 domain-containing protein [Lachnospiraceae bacterium]|nr:DUF4214 domain-containing protein [Lachnospiraceae bacterium]
MGFFRKGKWLSALLSLAMIIGCIGAAPMRAQAIVNNDDYQRYHLGFGFANGFPDASVIGVAEVGISIAPAEGSGGAYAYFNRIPTASQGNVQFYDVGALDADLSQYTTAGIDDTSEVRFNFIFFTNSNYQTKITEGVSLFINGQQVQLTPGEYDIAFYYTTTLQDLIDSTNGTFINCEVSYNPGNGGGDGGDQPGPGPQPGNFDGTAYLVWMSGDDVCYHYFSDLEYQRGTDGSVPVNYFAEADVTDQSGNDADFTIGGYDTYNWVLAADLDGATAGTPDPAKLNEEFIFGDGEMDRGIQLDPTGAVSGRNTFCTNADRNFRATIYNDAAWGIAFSESEDGYGYIPLRWDPTFNSLSRDLSGTTSTDWEMIDTYIAESELHFTKTPYTTGTLTSVTALDVTPGAVTVSEENGAFTVTFNSNYFDHVVLAVSTSDGQTGYVLVHRYFLDTYVENQDQQGGRKANRELRATLTYPDDYGYEDFEMVAALTYADGSVVTATLEPAEYDADVPDGQNIRLLDAYTAYAGAHLSSSQYIVDAEDATLADLKAVNFTATFTGADSEAYAGTFGGSGAGVGYTITYYDDYDSYRVEEDLPVPDSARASQASPQEKVISTVEGDGDITELTLVGADGNLKVTGTAKAGVLAVAIAVTAGEDELLAFQTTAVNADGTFSAEGFPLSADSYVVKAANYNGGETLGDAVLVGGNLLYVELLYDEILGRVPDAEGLDGWVEGLNDHSLSVANILEGFFLSPEVLDKGMTGTELVTMMYQVILLRDPAEGEVAAWVAKLDAGELTIPQLLASFVNSPEAQANFEDLGLDAGGMYSDGTVIARGLRAFVERMYEVVLGRESEKKGFYGWADKVMLEGLSPRDIPANFFGSPEYTNLNKTDAEFITDCYLAILGRAPAADEVAGWIEYLADEANTRADVVYGFTISQEFTNLLATYELQ